MSDIALPYRPRAAEDPQAAGVVQANLEYLTSLIQKGTQDGDLLQWDTVLGRFVAGPAVQAAPVGIGQLWFTDTAPPKWLLLKGDNISRTTYADLFALWGTSFGAGDGSTTFGTPDLRGRIPVGKGTHADVDTLGENDGAALADRRPKHKHVVNDSGHGHNIQLWQTGTGQALPNDNILSSNGTADGTIPAASNTTGVTVGPQAAGTPTDTPSFIVVNYIVYVGV